MAKIAGTLPKGDGNGLGPIMPQLLGVPHKVHAALVLIDCRSTNVNHDTGDLEPTVRIRRLEVILPGDLDTARLLLDRSYEHRSGQTVLPFDLEQDVKKAFVDMETGEITFGPDGAGDPGDDA